MVILIVSDIKKYRAMGFGLQNKELEAASILVGR